MTKEDPHHWLDLCKAAAGTTNPNEFLKIVRELNEVLEREQQEGGVESALEHETAPCDASKEVRCQS